MIRQPEKPSFKYSDSKARWQFKCNIYPSEIVIERTIEYMKGNLERWRNGSIDKERKYFERALANLTRDKIDIVFFNDSTEKILIQEPPKIKTIISF